MDYTWSLNLDKYRNQYRSYSLSNHHLIDLQASLIEEDCNTSIDLPCSLQMTIDIYFNQIQYLFVYYSFILLSMICISHRTVSFMRCTCALLIIIVIFFGTNLILYFDNTVYNGTIIFGISTYINSFLEFFMPYSFDDLHSVSVFHLQRISRSFLSIDR